LPPDLFSSNQPATPEIYTLSLHDALPISFSSKPCTSSKSRRAKRTRRDKRKSCCWPAVASTWTRNGSPWATAIGGGDCWPTTRRSEEHTSELQSRSDLVCRLLLEKKKKIK